MIEKGSQADFVYIDGNHNFDYVMVDFFLADKLLSPGGVVAFNDAGWRSVHKVIRLLQKFRDYDELDVGLPRRYDARNPLFSFIKRLRGQSRLDRYFRKSSDWEPPHGFHAWF